MLGWMAKVYYGGLKLSYSTNTLYYLFNIFLFGIYFDMLKVAFIVLSQGKGLRNL